MFFSDSAAAIYRRWLKSQTALACLAVLLFALSAAFCGLQLEPDYFWHVKLGEWIVQHQSIMEADTFSWTAQEYPVTEFAHSWLGSVVIYLFSLLGRYFSYQHAGAILYELCFYAILLAFCSLFSAKIFRTSAVTLRSHLYLPYSLRCVPVTVYSAPAGHGVYSVCADALPFTFMGETKGECVAGLFLAADCFALGESAWRYDSHDAGVLYWNSADVLCPRKAQDVHVQ